MTEQEERELVREVGEIHAVLTRNGLIKQVKENTTRISFIYENRYNTCPKSKEIEDIEKLLVRAKNKKAEIAWRIAQAVISLSGWAAVLVVILS